MKIRVLLLTIATICFLTVNLPAADDSFAGSWYGTLDISGVKLRLVFHLEGTPEGGYKATLDSPDQGAKGIPASSVSQSGKELTIAVSSIQGQYSGTVDDSLQQLTGQWRQGGRAFPLNLTRQKGEITELLSGVPVSSGDRQKVTGTWEGRLRVNAVELRVVFRISADERNILQCSMDSPDQGARNIPTSSIIFADDSLRIDVPVVAGYYAGAYLATGPFFEGRWHQAGRAMPLKLARVTEASKPSRPQEPVAPYPYKDEDVVFRNDRHNLTLAGTLTLPDHYGRFPAAVLISGSGPQNRDEELLGHKPFLVIADYLTRNNIAVLRVDDRGVGESGGDFVSATTEDFVSDVLAAVGYLKSRPEIDISHIGLIGHSEGGLIAPMAATRSKDVAFIVMLAGPGLPGDEVLFAQNKKLLQHLGASPQLLDASRRQMADFFTVMKTEHDDEVAEQRIRELHRTFMAQADSTLIAEVNRFGDPEARLEANLQMLLTPWFRFFIAYDPVPTLQKVTCPVLALNGEKDFQVSAGPNLAAIKSALRAGGNADYTCMELKGLNHMFQNAETGAPQEYARIEQTVAPAVIKMIADWINTRAL